jgi:hypothetical protein
MHYDAELQFLTDTFRKYSLPVTTADPANAPSPGLFLHLAGENAELPLKTFLPALDPATVYTMQSGPCHYTYFLLPEREPDTILLLGPYLTDQPSLKNITEWAEQENADPRQHRQLEKYFSSLPVLPMSSHLHLMLDAFFDRL